MKISHLLLIVCVTVFFQSAFTQNTKTPVKSGVTENTPEQKNAKETYINNQNYLSESALKDYKSDYGDSLRGFDEKKIKAELLNHGVYGAEYLLYIKQVKRDYINKKYHLQPPLTGTHLQSNYNQSGTLSKTIGGGNFVNIAPCVNEDFETSSVGQYTTANAISGWTVSSQAANSCNTNTVWNAGSSKFWIVSTPITGVPSIGILNASPLGGTKIAQLQNNIFPYSLRTKLATSFPVSLSNTVFQFAYAGVYNDGGHQCCEQPALQVKMYDCQGNPLACSSLSLNAVGAGCTTGSGSYTVSGGTSWTNWQVKYIDLTPYVGTCVTIEIINSDCIFGGHYGMTFFDAKCGGQVIGSGVPSFSPNTASFTPVSYCAGSNLATIAAPIGYASYLWFGPGMVPIAAPNGTQQIVSISNPTPGAIFTVDLTTSSGCVYTASNSLTTSTVSIVGLGTTTSCAGGASGSATVVGNGSGTGYTYTWTNSSNSVVSSGSVAMNLTPGVYTVGISGAGSSGCGTAYGTATITNGVQPVINLIKPFCNGNPAYFNTNGGSNIQWYGSSGAIAASSGGTSQTYTISNPVTGSIVTLTYISPQGCQDSVRFTLAGTSPGLITASNISYVCPGGSNGTAQIYMSMSAGSVPGSNSLSINSTGTTTPYTYNLSQSSSTLFPLTGLSAGTYSINAFDGSCYYTSNFAVTAYTFNYNVSPNSPTLCPGNSIAAGVSFSSPPSLNQYSYNWTPTTFLVGNVGTNPSTIISPTTTIGSQTTIVYTIVVTPSIVNCPVTKTISVTLINPNIPTFSTIPELCDNSSTYQIQTSIPGGTFSTGFTGTNSPVNLNTGLITPSHSNIALGVNHFTYAININTCIAKSSGTYEVSKFYSSALSSSVPPLCVTSPSFNLMNIVQNTVNGTWSGTSVNNNYFICFSANIPTTIITYSCPSSPNPNACPSFTNLVVTVTNTLTPTITPVPEFCNNAAAFSMTVTPPGGTWSGPNGVNSLGIITPSNITSSAIALNYSVAIGPCVNTATNTLQISKFYSAALTGTVPHMCYNSSPFNLMSIVQNTINGTWSGLNGILSNSFIPSVLPTNIYTAMYSTFSSPNATLCPDSKTIAISNLHPPTPTLTAVETLCSNASNIQLDAQPTNGFWTNTTYLSANGVFSPSLSAIGNNLINYSVGTTTCNVQQSAFITVEAFVPATILSNIPDLCNTSQALNLTPLTLSQGGTWIGDGINGNYFNPQLSGAGNFTLKYTTASSPSGLCPDEAITSVNVYSLATPHIIQQETMCNSSLPVQLKVNPVGGLFGGSNHGVIGLSGIFNPANAKIGDNLISYSITSGPCVAYTQTIIRVEEFVSANLSKQINPLCKNAEPMNLNSFVENTGGTWEGPGVFESMFDPSKATIGANNILVYTTYSFPSGKLCPDTAAVRIDIHDFPKVTATANLYEGCAPLEILFNCPNVNSGKGTWNLGEENKQQSGLNLNHLFITPGTYKAVFNYEDEIGCKAAPVILSEIKVYDTPIANFDLPENGLISDPIIQATNLTRDLENNRYEWRISNATETISEVHPKFEFQKAGNYSIHLRSVSVHNCISDITKNITIKNNFNIYIPNAFSPNYDGLNDEFKPVFTEFGLDVSSYSMQIMDRWGHLVFKTKEVDKGWKGTSGESNEIMKQGIYNYTIRYKDNDGNWYEDKGHVSLVN